MWELPSDTQRVIVMGLEFVKGYIKEFLRILDPNGLLIFEIPNKRIQSNERITLKHRIKSLLPITLVNMYQRVKYGGQPPTRELHITETNEIMKFIEENNAQVIDTQESEDPAGGLRRCYYYVLRDENNKILHK